MRSGVRLRFLPLAAGVLMLAAFNVFFRLDTQAITEWDEALYALSASEMLHTGDWVATRLLGEIDYFNIKPPLNVWMIALSFKLFGIHPLSLRLPAAVSVCFSVGLLLWWARRAFDARTAVAAGLVLATSFPFLFVHSGRTANPDAPGALLILLTIVVLHAAIDKPWSRVWLGPVLVAAFLLRGMGVLMPLAIVVAFEAWRGRTGTRWRPLIAAAVLFLVPVCAWAFARWSIDGFAFLARLWTGEVARVTSPVETHTGTPLFYFNVLLKYQYEWLIAATMSLFVMRPWTRTWSSASRLRAQSSPGMALLICWAAITLLIPTVMQTKTTWYLNPFYPAFAVCVALMLVRAFERAAVLQRRHLAATLLAVVVIAFGAVEGRIIWDANRRDARHTTQGLLEATRALLPGHTVFRDNWTYADIFVLRDLIGTEGKIAPTVDEFLQQSEPGDYLIGGVGMQNGALEAVAAFDAGVLYRRR